ncbi:MAG: hypothetical protein JNK14_15610 [Chitinophagaceae bacterium]|nr:hypothetical protein [Chitinophagaceae bacterium]
MPATPSAMGLHLRLRLWIAELNSDISILRIFSDYLVELHAKKNIAEVTKGIDHFKQQFVILRNEIDELRHDMQLSKMHVASAARGNKTHAATHKTGSTDNQHSLQKRYTVFKKAFNKVKKEFGIFEAKWSD